MFDFAWSEIALIGVVALVLIGPKDLPIAIKTITAMVKKARRMAAEFQTHVDEMVKDADLGEVRDHIRDLRSLDIRGTIARAVDNDGSIRKAFTDPVRTPPPVVTTPVEAHAEQSVESHVEHNLAGPEPMPAWTPSVSEPTEATVHAAAAPAFIPPEEAAAPAQLPPAFIPPEAVHAHSPQRA